MKRMLCVGVVILAAFAAAGADDTRVLPPGKPPEDARLTKVRTLNDKDFDLQVPASKEAWEARRRQVREQVLVANGLWPMPEKTPLRPVVHGKIDREDYTIEKVFFASHPGHYVTGNLYRPKGKSGKLPGVLCPHGHWRDGRFFDAGEKAAQEQIKMGAEKTVEGARYPLQARCAELARLGCVVFHYDMVGYADSQQVPHRQGFTDAQAELRLQSFMGLQTWNSIRALDFLLGLPEVDAARIGVTGASGGGTQTFLLCGIDDRPAVAFPAVMVSTAMQGGCICENCSYLRQGAGNIELAGLFAPRPQAMTGANDWTREIETRGLPELKKLYGLYGAADLVEAKYYSFPHNYNQVSREMMYNWFNKHLKLGHKEPITERPFVPAPPKELSVYDAQHPLPKDAVDAARLRQYMTEISDQQIAKLLPNDPKGLAEYRRVVGTALRVMAQDELPRAEDVKAKEVGDKVERDGLTWRRYLISRKGAGEQVPAVGLRGKEFDGTVVVWVHPEGKASLFKDGRLAPAAQKLIDGKAAIFAPDVFQTGELKGEKPPAVNTGYAGYTFGYNRPLLANRVHDVLTAAAFVKGRDQTKKVHLVGFGEAGPWVLLARGLCGDAVARTAADMDQFRFEKVTTTGDAMMLPGALKYGGLPALAALAAPGELFAHNADATGAEKWLPAVYRAAGAADRLQLSADRAAEDKVVQWLVR
jgi:dienelactone hydrolase